MSNESIRRARLVARLRTWAEPASRRARLVSGRPWAQAAIRRARRKRRSNSPIAGGISGASRSRSRSISSSSRPPRMLIRGSSQAPPTGDRKISLRAALARRVGRKMRQWASSAAAGGGRPASGKPPAPMARASAAKGVGRDGEDRMVSQLQGLTAVMAGGVAAIQRFRRAIHCRSTARRVGAGRGIGRSAAVDLPAHDGDRLLVDLGGVPALDCREVRLTRLVAGAGNPAMAFRTWRSRPGRRLCCSDSRCHCRRHPRRIGGCSWAGTGCGRPRHALPRSSRPKARRGRRA